MPKRPTLKPIHVPGRERPWKIDLPASLSSTGQRARYFFESKQDAINFAEEHKIRLKNYGTAGISSLSPSQLEQAARAFAALEPHGVTLSELVADWNTRRRAAETTVTFEEGFRQFEQHLARKKIKGRAVSESYLRQVKYTFPRFPALHDKLLTEIDARMVAHATAGYEAIGQKQLPPRAVRILRVVRRGSSPMDERQSRRRTSQKRALAALRLNIHAGRNGENSRCVHPGGGLASVSRLGFFAGIRPEELERTRWEFVNLEEKAIVLPRGRPRPASSARH